MNVQSRVFLHDRTAWRNWMSTNLYCVLITPILQSCPLTYPRRYRMTLFMKAPESTALTEAKRWFRESRFGIFVHWGLYAIPGGQWKGKQISYIGEWTMHGEQIPVAEYRRLAAQFNPTAFNARDWVAMAEEAGARYIVLTTKHHEGFAMYHSKVDPYNIVDATPFGRDPLAELAEACKGSNVKLGIYYSQCVDWNEAHGGNLPDDWKNAPGVGPGGRWGNDWDFPPGTQEGFDAYLERKVKPQLREILSNYGPLAVLWFDTPTTGLKADKAKELYQLVRDLQPGCLMCTRLGCGLGDYESLGDNESPLGPMERLAESPITMNDTWGYKAHDQNWKAPSDMINMISDLASKNCNFLLNLGPQPDGRIPAASIDRLKAMGRWMKANSEAIYGAEPSPIVGEYPWGRMTWRGNVLYLHVSDPTCTTVALRGLRVSVVSARWLGDRMDGPPVVTQDGVFTLCTFPASSDPFPRVIGLDLLDKPDFDSVPAPQLDGLLTVPSVRFTGESHGLLWNGWCGPGEVGYCHVRFDKPGDYDMTIYTGGRDYGSWHGGHGLEIQACDQSFRFVIMKDEDVHNLRTQHYPVAGTHAGRLHVSRAGLTNIRIFVHKVVPPTAFGAMSISSLVFRPV